MISINQIYHNPTIPPGKYFVKITKLLRGPYDGKNRPLLQVWFRISDRHGDLGGTQLALNIHPTRKADVIFEMFLGTFFGHDGGKLSTAVGRYARVQVKAASYKGTSYSAVKFFPQRCGDIAEANVAKKIDKEIEKQKAEAAKKKAKKAAKKQAEKDAYEKVHGKRGRGRPRKGWATEDLTDIFA